MIYKTYELVSLLPAQAVLGRIEALLSEESVKCRVDNLSVTSTQTPVVLVGFDPRGYSDTNWVGVNPFAFVSGIEVRCESGDGGLTKVSVRVNRFRTFIWVAFWIALSSLAPFVMPKPGGITFLIGLSCAAWLGYVPFVGGYLIKKEIGDQLKLKDPITG